MQSEGSAAKDTRGKHRISAELKRLEQEARFLEEELEHLDKMEKASAACKEIASSVERRPDPLLPVTTGPLNPSWDQWFERPPDSSGCRYIILGGVYSNAPLCRNQPSLFLHARDSISGPLVSLA